MAEHGVTDLTIEDPPVEDVIEQVLAAAASAEAAARGDGGVSIAGRPRSGASPEASE